MEYTGLIWKYKLDRPLTEQEKKDQLHQAHKCEVEPIDQISVIKKNACFLEIVDKFYAIRGTALLFMLVGLGLFGYETIWFVNFSFFRSQSGSIADFSWIDLFSIVLLLASVIFFGYFSCKESFTYTHWPVRFCRKNRMVYVFRHNGENGVLAIPWDDVFFTLGYGGGFMGIRNCYLCGHLVDQNNTVRDTFGFGYVSNDQDIETVVWPHWEYIRRYMEEGPDSVYDIAENDLLLIADRRETFSFSIRRSWFTFGHNPFVYFFFMPLMTLVGLARYLAMQTSKIPRWPEHVKAACGEEPSARN